MKGENLLDDRSWLNVVCMVAGYSWAMVEGEVYMVGRRHCRTDSALRACTLMEHWESLDWSVGDGVLGMKACMRKKDLREKGQGN